MYAQHEKYAFAVVVVESREYTVESGGVLQDKLEHLRREREEDYLYHTHSKFSIRVEKTSKSFSTSSIETLSLGA